jgi:hypothetical protein
VICVRYPSEGRFHGAFTLKTNLDAIDNLRRVEQVDRFITSVDRYLAEFYSARGVADPLLGHITSMSDSARFASPEFQRICLAVIRPKFDFLRGVKSDCTTIAKLFVDIFVNKDLWERGRYSDRFVDQLCLLIRKCHALEQLALVKKGMVNDISVLLKYVGNEFRTTAEFQEILLLRAWSFTRHVITNDIITAIISADIPQEQCLLVFQIMVRQIRARIEGCQFLYPEMQYAYIDAYVFLIRFFKARRHAERLAYKKLCGIEDGKGGGQALGKKEAEAEKKKLKKYKKMVQTKLKLEPFKPDLVGFTQSIFASFPNVPQYMEMTEIVEEGVWVKAREFSGKKKNKSSSSVNIPDMDEQLRLLNATSGELSHYISQIVASEAKANDLSLAKTIIDEIVDVLHHIGGALNRVRERLSLRLVHPPSKCDREITNFEKSMRFGIAESGNLLLSERHFCYTLKNDILILSK